MPVRVIRTKRPVEPDAASARAFSAVADVEALPAAKYDTLRGPVTIDEMRNPVQNIYIKKVEKKKMFGYDKEELWNTVIKTYENVNQFGQFKKAEFLATPVYGRDYPPCKFCN